MIISYFRIKCYENKNVNDFSTVLISIINCIHLTLNFKQLYRKYQILYSISFRK